MPSSSMTLKEAFALALRLHRDGRLREAEEIYRQILTQVPDEPDALQLSGLIAHDQGQSARAVELISRAVSINPSVAAYHNHLGIALRGAGRLDASAEAYRTAIALRADFADAHYNLGNLLEAKGQADQAIASYRRAMELNPDSPAVYANLAKIFHDHAMWDEVIAACRQALRIKPDLAEASDQLAFALALQGRVAEAIAAYRHATKSQPANAEIHSRLIQTMLYDSASDAPTVLAECRRWNARHAEPLKGSIRPHTNDRSPDRRLRIGYVSADFRAHACAIYSEPLLAAHDKEQFEIVCYAEVSKPDAVTERLRAHASDWHNIVGMSDDSVAALVRSDRIDILVDLNLHTSRNRLLTFARKPAPVQVSWLGFPGTTGLDAINYRLTDPHLDPPGEHDSWYSEKSIRLADSFWCYSSREDDLPLVAPPAMSRGSVTFGSMNSFCKINPLTLDLWAAAMNAVEGSRLHILADAGTHRDQTVAHLSSRGIAPQRISFDARRPHREYMLLFNEIDIALDTYPYNGQTTTLDGLWMGVPIVTMTGSMAVSRSGLSLLSNLGCPDWAVTDEASFASTARSLGTDLARLADLRQSLRSRMKASPLMDADRFTRSVEQAYRGMWRSWCDANR